MPHVRKYLHDVLTARAIAAALVIGLAAYVLIIGGVRLLVPGTVFYTDPREVFMTIGAALTGPVGTLILAFFLGIARSAMEGIPYRVLAYLVGGLCIAVSYRSLLHRRLPMPWLVLGWAVTIPLYYFVTAVVGLGVPFLFDRTAYAAMIGGDRPLLESLLFLGSALRYEVIFTGVVTSVFWSALPRRYRIPLWGPPHEGPAPSIARPNGLRHRLRTFLAGRYLGIRLSIWFLLLSIIPIFGVVVTVEHEAREEFDSAYALHRQAQAQLVAGMIDRLRPAEINPLILKMRAVPQALLVVVDTSGRYVSHETSAKIGHSWDEDFEPSVRTAMMTRGSGSTIDQSGQTTFGYSWTFDGRHLVVMGFSSRPLLLTTERLTNAMQGRLALALSFIAITVGMVIWFMVARPLRILTKAVESTNRDHLSATVPAESMDDEVRVLGEAFNSMTGDLRTAYRGLEEEIAERVVATDLLRKSRAQLAEALRIARMGSFEVNLRWMTITLTEEALGLFGPVGGMRPDVAAPLRHFLPAVLDPLDLPRIEQAFLSIVDSTIIVPPREEEYRIRRSDGSRAWLSFYYSVVWEGGRPATIVGTIQDITARKRAEAESEAAKRKFQAVVENNLDAILLVDRLGAIKYGSPSLEDILGRAVTNAGALSIFDGVHEDDLPMVRLSFEDIRDRDGASARKIYRVRHANGSWVWVESIVKNALADPAVHSIVVNLRDITERKHAEEELLRLRQAVEISNEIVFMTDPEGVFRYVNRAFTSFYGYSPEEVVGKVTPRILKSGLMPNGAYERFWGEMRNDQGVHDEITNRRKDGSLALVEATANAVRDSHGKIVGYLAIQRDITERKRAEEAIRHSEESLRVAQRIGKIGSWEVDVSQQRTTWSKETYRILGRDPESFTPEAMTYINAVHPDERARVREDLVGTVQRGLSLRSQHRIVLPDGTIKYVETLGEVEHGPDGTPIRVVGSIQDITETKRFEEALNDRLRRLQLLRELGFLFASTLEQPEIIRKVSIFIPQYLGVTRAIIRFVDPDSSSLVAPPDAEADGSSDGTVDRQPSGFSISGKCLEENRPLLVNDCRTTDLIPAEWVEHFRLRSVLAVPIRTSTGVIGVLRVDDSERYDRFTETDVEFVSLVADQLAVALENARLYAAAKQAEAETERLNAELEQRVQDRTAQLESVNKELESFSYSVSHDLRAPLRHISGFVELLRERIHDLVDDESLRYLDTVSSSAVRLGNLIDELLAFSRISRTDLRTAQVDLSKVVHEIRKELEPEIGDRKVVWEVAALPPVRGDITLLKLVMSNLLSNALKFSRDRDPARIEVGALPVQNQGELVTLFVRDNGAGFDQAYAGKLFGVFQRLHSNEEFEGTGIGLANVRRIVQRHGGTTWAEGMVDAGATIYFTLPSAERA